MKLYAIENHPADSRVTMDDSGIVQTMSARMGTGGGNTPMVLIVEENDMFFAMEMEKNELLDTPDSLCIHKRERIKCIEKQGL